MGRDQLLLTIGNPVATPRSVAIAPRGLRDPLRILASQGVVAADLNSPNYTTQPVPCKVDRQVLRLQLPPSSYVSIRLATTRAANE